MWADDGREERKPCEELPRMNFRRLTFMVEVSPTMVALMHLRGPVRPIIRAQPEDAETLPYLFWKEAMAQASGKELWQ